MVIHLDSKFNSPSKNMLTTVAKSLKFAVIKNDDVLPIEELIPNFFQLCSNKEIDVKKFALESLGSVAYIQPQILRKYTDQIVKICASESRFLKEYIVEIDLGPFKHKTDEGRGLRVAAFTLLYVSLQKLAEKISTPDAISIAIEGIADEDGDCQTIALQILMRLMKIAPGLVIGQIHVIIDRSQIIIDKQKKLSKTQVTNLMRIVVKTIISMKQLPDIETSSYYQEFYTKLINDQEVAPVISEVSQ